MELSVVLQYLFPSWSEMLTSVASAIVVALLAYLLSQSPSSTLGDEREILESLEDEASFMSEESTIQKQQALLAAALKAEGIPISVPVRQVGAGELAVPPRPLVIGLDAQDVLRRGMGARRTRPRRAEPPMESRVVGKAGDVATGTKIGKLTTSEANRNITAGAGMGAAAASVSGSPTTWKETTVQRIRATAAAGKAGNGRSPTSPAGAATVVTLARAASSVPQLGDILLKETLSEPGRSSDPAISLQASSRESSVSELRSPGNQGVWRSPEKKREGWGGESKQAAKVQKLQEKQQRQQQRQEQRQEQRDQRQQQLKQAKGQVGGVGGEGDPRRQLRATKTINESLMRRLCVTATATATASASATHDAVPAAAAAAAVKDTAAAAASSGAAAAACEVASAGAGAAAGACLAREEGEGNGNGTVAAAASGTAAAGVGGRRGVVTTTGAGGVSGALVRRQSSCNELAVAGPSSPDGALLERTTSAEMVRVRVRARVRVRPDCLLRANARTLTRASTWRVLHAVAAF